jgi:hypothetical protein
MPEEECEGDTSDECEECIVKVQFFCMFVNCQVIQSCHGMWYMNHQENCLIR